jgi:YVTN family beta-propeller protein
VSSVDELPVGTVTFLFTDIEGSTQLLKQMGGELYAHALDDHRRILRDGFAEHDGREIDTQGDSFFVAFRRAKDAVACAIACQRTLMGHSWPEDSALRVRMGIHTGEPAVGGERYVGMGVHRAARICASGHGGQVLVSQTTRELLRDDPIPEVTLRDLGEHQLKDMDEPERIYQLVAPGLQETFPELKTAARPPFEGREGELAEAASEELARPWRRPSRRALVAATFAAALVGVTVGVLLTQGGGSTASASVSANAVGVIDADSGEVVSEVPVGGAPGEIASGLGAIWVTNANDNTVSRIDPATNQVAQTIRVGEGPTGIAVGAGGVWVANGLDGTVSRIDPTTNEEVLRVTVGNGPSGVAHGVGATWVTNSVDGTVSRIASGASRVSRQFPAAVGASGIAVGFGRIWIASPPTASVVALDPGSGRVLREIGVGGEPSALATGAGAVWVTNRADGTVSMIDPESDSVRDLIPIGREPEGIAVDSDAVWVTNGGDGSLVRLNPSTGETTQTLALDNPPHGVALTPDGVYVAVRSTGIEHRGGTLEALLGTGPQSLDPAIEGFGLIPVLTLTNDGLVGFRRVGGVEGSQLVPNLAVALPAPTDGGRTYTFQVRPGIRYSNGDIVEPEDFKRAIERLFVIESDAGGEGYYQGIVGANRCTTGKPCDLSGGITVDRTAGTITFHLTEPDADFLAKLAMPFAVAVPRGAPPRKRATRPLPATGPYRIAGLNRKSKTIRLVRNSAFREWSADAQPDGYPDSITLSWRFGYDISAAMRAAERGAVDVVSTYGPPPSKETLDELAVRAPGQLRLSPTLGTEGYFLNTRVAPFDDTRARRAVNIAFDRETFVRTLGRAFAPTCHILPPNLPGYRPTCPYGPGGAQHLDAARRLVRSSGTRGAVVTVAVPRPIAHQAQYIASVLDSLGYRARVRPISPDAYFTEISDSRTQTQAGYSGWIASYPSAADFLPPLFSCAAFVPASPGANSNLSGFCDPSVDAKMSAATDAQAQDPAAATTLWQQAERAILAQAPFVPAYNRSDVNVVSKRVGNFQYNPQWGVLLSQLWVR